MSNDISIKDKVFNTSVLTSPVTDMYIGVKDIKVGLIDCTENPYKSIVDMALATWGTTSLKRWEILSPEERFYVVSRVFKRKALPLGLESLIFLFSIENVSRSSFDQIARTRIGATISSLGWNNIHTQTGFRIPNEIAKKRQNDFDFLYELEQCLSHIKDLYHRMVEDGISWQSAREILPLGLLHQFYFSITYMALQNFCSRRLCFSEKEDTVAVSWLMRERVKERFPFIASHLKPACDASGRCGYHSGDSLPEHMGSLFKPCGRNKCTVNNLNIEFDIPSTDVNDLISQLGISIPKSGEDIPVSDFDKLSAIDKKIFNE